MKQYEILVISTPIYCIECGMAFITQGDLYDHEIIVHLENGFQCQSCYLFFEDKKQFTEHAIIHSPSPNINRLKKLNENHLRKQKEQSHKARKRSRGPYRKSHSLKAMLF